MAAFSEFGVLPEIVQSIEELDWLLPTDVQAEAVPLILGGGDVLMAAETGSGKTGAFCLPVIQVVYETLNEAASGGKPKKEGCFLNPSDKDPMLVLSENNNRCSCTAERAWQGARSTTAVHEGGKYYYEATIADGLCRVGWATPQATRDLGGRDHQSFGWGGTGKKSFGGQFDSYGGPFGKDDVIGCFLDLDSATIKFSKNGRDEGKAFDIPENLYHSDFCAGVTIKKAALRVNFGDQPFQYPPTKGFIGLAQAKEKVPQFIGGQKSKETGGPKSKVRKPMALILEPSRELAQQTHDNVVKLKKHLQSPQLEALLVVGGTSSADQISALERGVDIVTGTPGRIEDLVSNSQLKLDNVRFFILDEADGLLTQGYEKFILSMYGQIPRSQMDGRRMQMVVCSATLHSFEVKKLAEKLMHFPTWVDLKGQDSVPETVHHAYCFVDPQKDTLWHSLRQHVETDGVHQRDNTRAGMVTKEAMSEAVKKLKGEYLVRAIDEHKMDQAIIFCRTKLDCDNMERYLQTRGRSKYSCVCLHSDRKPQERKSNLEKFKSGEAKFLLCTDVAARGIDVRGVPFMINVTLPDEKQNYIHRIGRVGRAERMGLAVSLVANVEEKVWYHKCPSRGKSCNNTRLVDEGGCTIWYNELKFLRDVESHLDITIPEIEHDLKVVQNEFDGKVTYGEKKKAASNSVYKNHVEQLASTVKDLAALECQAQSSFLRLRNKDQWKK